MYLKKKYRDFYNLIVTHFPSRHVRHFCLRRLLGRLDSGAFVCMHSFFYDPWSISLGQRSVVNAGCSLDGRGGPLQIGEDVDIGTQSHIWTLSHDPDDPEHGTIGAPVTIEDHVWIASRVTILPGVTLGRGSVVAAGAVVTKSVDPLTIVAGVPARKIGMRDNPLVYKLNFSPRFR